MTDKVPAHSEMGSVRPSRQEPGRAPIREDGFNQAGSVKEQGDRRHDQVISIHLDPPRDLNSSSGKHMEAPLAHSKSFWK